MVVFQNKIIYMPGLPPNARREKIEDYKNQCGGIQWREERTVAADGTRISLCVANVNCELDTDLPVKTVYVLYFQGNASSIPPRLPFLSPVLRLLSDRATFPARYTMVCCSYRGYWTSKGRPSENGIAMDAVAALKWIREPHGEEAPKPPAESIPIVFWGQSIGAGVATGLAAQAHIFSRSNFLLKAVILETPFLSIRAMLETLYPQKWLPYRYLWPFLRNHLDSWAGLGLMRRSFREIGLDPPSILILEAGRDELVPKEHATALERRCLEVGLGVKRRVISNALHTEVMARSEGRLAVCLSKRTRRTRTYIRRIPKSVP
ncbi:alpha/beta-hydrolase [Mollisia scopiformis]|uniref:Alpha/beta-hydrolase n=1 Tax=Mollisia scopiformis TaxID=149040 RepID=A0A132B998_MOLSC|nr:alpha/beta-hydrolase [Mollisia scopiformis]KUJ08833.1 alpha/beta-hydrolase [Mollisia scopiformis]